LVAFGAAVLAVGLLVLARAGAVARTDAARGRALCIRCCVWALFAVLAVFIAGGVAGYLTRARRPSGGARWPASYSSPWSVWRPASASYCRSEPAGELVGAENGATVADQRVPGRPTSPSTVQRQPA
jgi:hypothetical protein